ncbi:MAG TPA: NAD-dependent epimerase/dehydratase family protein [Rhizomicrobium sp.]|jgi:nucleoside-diphosphate-sugar epimerase
MVETVLVTGGTGFIGGWCIVELLKRGYAVRTTMRDPSKEAAVRAIVAAGGASAERLSFCIADLMNDFGWDAAVAGCDRVLHVASPLGGNAAPDAMLAAARDGTLRVLQAAIRAGVKRVVMTSAAAAARTPMRSRKVSDETVWANPAEKRFDGYRRSKILAERAAWDFMAGKSMEFTTILPGAVFGPVLSNEAMSSVQIVAGLLQGRPAAIPKLGFWIVDVRDLADLHIRAMIAPEAADQRFIATGDFMWMIDIAKTLRARLGKRAAKVPTRVLPNAVARLLALFSPQLKALAPELGRRNDVTSAKARRMLGFAPRPAADTLADCAESVLGGKPG